MRQGPSPPPGGSPACGRGEGGRPAGPLTPSTAGYAVIVPHLPAPTAPLAVPPPPRGMDSKVFSELCSGLPEALQQTSENSKSLRNALLSPIWGRSFSTAVRLHCGRKWAGTFGREGVKLGFAGCPVGRLAGPRPCAGTQEFSLPVGGVLFGRVPTGPSRPGEMEWVHK